MSLVGNWLKRQHNFQDNFKDSFQDKKKWLEITLKNHTKILLTLMYLKNYQLTADSNFLLCFGNFMHQYLRYIESTEAESLEVLSLNSIDQKIVSAQMDPLKNLAILLNEAWILCVTEKISSDDFITYYLSLEPLFRNQIKIIDLVIEKTCAEASNHSRFDFR